MKEEKGFFESLIYSIFFFALFPISFLFDDDFFTP